MRKSWIAAAAAFTVSNLMIIVPAHAAVFPDVPEGHLFQMPIENLVGLKVINGNPDGTFKPEKSVNRAEMLAMLYRARGITPASKRGCFPDVQPGSWYELYVCDAAAKNYVKGYDDGYFRPNKEVNRVEALKMIMTVFGMNVPETQGSNWTSLTFADVSVSQWYAKFLLHAWNMNIVPIAGMSNSMFWPEASLKRGEAAAFIYNALHASPRSQAVSSSSAAAASSAMPEQTAARSSRSSVATGDVVMVKDLTIPASLSGNFKKKAPAVYRFTLTAITQLSIDARLGGNFVGGMISCRLYKIESDGFSNEYYLGYQEGGLCQLRTRLAAGTYQLELQPAANDAVYTLDVKTGKGDNNDGFVEAKTLLQTQPRSDQLDIGDMADWYKFTLSAEKQMSLVFVNDGTATCIVYPMADVDIYGFSQPGCNESYLFPKGSYYVGIIRKNDRHDHSIYTLQMK
jgi:hypothetical protein